MDCVTHEGGAFAVLGGADRSALLCAAAGDAWEVPAADATVFPAPGGGSSGGGSASNGGGGGGGAGGGDDDAKAAKKAAKLVADAAKMAKLEAKKAKLAGGLSQNTEYTNIDLAFRSYWIHKSLSCLCIHLYPLP
jgi:ABC-type glycerol-3-phosphate transport system substrate-binding protein